MTRRIAPVHVVLFTLAFIAAYILLRGPERFCYESFGTWIISPVIYARILPDPLSSYLVTTLVRFPQISYIFYAVPVLMFVGAISAAGTAIFRRSLPMAATSLCLILTLFGVYHLLQPMGIQLIVY